MKSLSQVAVRYLLEKKKRTILTILGIIISVAMITSIGTMIYSMEQYELRATIERSGYNHGAFLNIDHEQYQYIKGNVGFSKVAKSVMATTGYWESEYGRASYIELVGYEEDYLEMRNTLPAEGRLPENENEIVVERWKARELGVEIGEEIEIPIGHLRSNDGRSLTRGDRRGESFGETTFDQVGVHSFKLVGIVENSRFSQAWEHSIAIVDLDWAERVNDSNKVTVIVRVKEGLETLTTLYTVSQELDFAEENLQINYNLIRRERGERDAVLVTIAAFLIGIVCVATIAVIFNSFNISVMERIKQFGIMRSIGTTPWQIRKIVFTEATILNLVSIPIGLASGFYATKILFYLLTMGEFSSFNNLIIITSNSILLVSSLIAAVAVYLSALIPAISAGRVAPLDAIFFHRSLKKETKSKGGFLLGKVFGAEGLLAYKNIKRNRKRLMITAFSISISVILFVVFSVFTFYTLRINENMFRYNADFELYTWGENLFTEDELKEILEVQGLKNVEPLRIDYVTALIEPDKVSQFLHDTEWVVEGSGRLYNNFIKGYNDSQLELLSRDLREGTIDKGVINREQGVVVVLNSEYYDQEEYRTVVSKEVDLKVGDTIQVTLDRTFYEADEHVVDEELISLKVVGIVDRSPIAIRYPQLGSIGLITTEEVYRQVTGNAGYATIYVDLLEEEGNYNEVFTVLENIADRRSDARLNDWIAHSRGQRQVVLEISVLIYGFITLISLIGALNIINTISTNLLTRTKEFSMLRAVGMSPTSMKRMIRLEAIFSSFMGTIFGLLLGNLLGYFLYTLINRYEGYVWVFPNKANAIAVIATLLIALIASIAPTKKIASLNIIENLKEE